MIRVFALVLGLGMGLVVAVVIEGRMAHLRALPGVTLPAWTTSIDARAGLLDGSAGPLAGGTILRWRLDGLDGGRPVWRLTTEGEGLTLAADLHPGLTGEGRLSALRGRVDLAALRPATLLEGRLDILRGEGSLVPGGPVILHAEGIASAIVLPGEAGPMEGRFGLGREAGGGWRLRILPAPDGPALIEVYWPADGTPATITLTDRDGQSRSLAPRP